MTHFSLGRGISIRREFLGELRDRLVQNDSKISDRIDWVEIIPENFIGRGGFCRRALLQIAERLPVICHGVSLSIGSVDELNWDFLKQLKLLIQDTRARWFTDHISYSSVNGFEFHDLLPLPFNRKAIRHVVNRIKQVQDFLDVPVGFENPSYYKIMPESDLSEAEFITEIVNQSGCFLLLDVNNVYVNSCNHTADPLTSARAFLKQIPSQKVQEIHIAGHRKIEFEGQERILDTHGAAVSEPVQVLLNEWHQIHSVENLLLERENNLPPLDAILDEISGIWTGLKK